MRTSRGPTTLQTSFRSAQKVPPGGVNSMPPPDEDDLLEDELPEGGTYLPRYSRTLEKMEPSQEPSESCRVRTPCSCPVR